jgi:hypothetical protein
MANLKVDWVLPTTRDSGRPLPLSEIAHVSLFISADGGQNYVKFNDFAPDVLSTVITDLEPGTWYVSGLVTDTQGRASGPVVAFKNIPDNSPPGVLLSLNLSL